MKYLGVRVVLDRKEQSKVAKEQINKNVNMLRNRLKRAEPDVLQQLTCCLARSLLIYIGTPMVTIGLWRKRDIDQLEAAQYRKILGCNNTITNKAILHTMTSMKLAGDAIMQLQRGVYEQYTKQYRITRYFDKVEPMEVSPEECECTCHQTGADEVYPRESRIQQHSKKCRHNPV